MKDLRPQFGFPATSDYRYRLRDRRYRVGWAGEWTLGLFSEIYLARRAVSHPNWLIPLRKQIRQIERLGSRGLLSFVVEQTSDPTVRLLAIWLRGRCGQSIGTSVLACFANDPDERTRKEVARALKRMNAWFELQTMAQSDPSERIRRMATPLLAKPYRERLAQLSVHLSRVHQSSVKQAFFIAPEVEIGRRQLPKSASVIRAILERIHRMVTGS